jgi:hypothetical protein
MLGTASTIRRWLLVEHDGPWGADALRDARLPSEVRATLRRAERDLGVRVLFVRRPDRASAAPTAILTIAAIDTGPDDPRIERTDLPDLEALIGTDLTSFAAGGTLGWPRSPEPLLIVCTQGRRDPCCAERGRPLATALARGFPDQTWESTHVGGDRFAGNLVIFPEGLYFGRVDPDGAIRVAAAYLDGRIDLARFRGRACYPMDVQAAEQILRFDTGWDRLDAVAFDRAERLGTITRVAFLTPDGLVSVTLERLRGAPARLTCHAEQPGVPPGYRPVAIEPVGIPRD